MNAHDRMLLEDVLSARSSCLDATIPFNKRSMENGPSIHLPFNIMRPMRIPTQSSNMNLAMTFEDDMFQSDSYYLEQTLADCDYDFNTLGRSNPMLRQERLVDEAAEFTSHSSDGKATIQTKRKGRAPSSSSFPTKLYKILCDPTYSEYVAWLPHGRAWRILKPKAFEEDVIPKFFRSDRYASFMRQVRNYFHKYWLIIWKSKILTFLLWFCCRWTDGDLNESPKVQIWMLIITKCFFVGYLIYVPKCDVHKKDV